jgi:hypothetical protein
MGYHVVRQGDHVARIAEENRLEPDAIWNHPNNEELRGRRESQHVLAEGDVLYLPEAPAPRHHPLTRGTTNRVRATIRTTALRLVIRMGDETLRNEPCVVEGLPAPLEARTDGEGLLEVEVPMNVDEVVIRLPNRHFQLAARVGHLDPPDEDRGAVSRLVNLGYLLPLELFGGETAVHGSMFQGEERARWTGVALAAFQSDQGLEPTGSLDAATREALARAHGG